MWTSLCVPEEIVRDGGPGASLDVPDHRCGACELLLLTRLEFCAIRLDCDLSMMGHDLIIVPHDLSF